jgi:hypothetical protein
MLVFRPIPSYGTLMPLSDFLDSVSRGSFIDYDGSGHLATEHERSNVEIVPSNVVQVLQDHPEYNWATHVVWYNR